MIDHSDSMGTSSKASLETHIPRPSLVIFDLDNCIMDTFKMPRSILGDTIAAIDNAAVASELKESIKNDLWTMSLLDIFEKWNFPEAEREPIAEAYKNMRAQNAVTFGDEEVLLKLKEKGISVALVTTGLEKFQQSKIDALGMRRFFGEAMYIDATDDPSTRKGKTAFFRDIAAASGVTDTRKVMVVGDNPNSELKSARELGMVPVQTLRPGIQADPLAERKVKDLHELLSFITSLS
jgi:FMN phosphatase YigB (HAD superfamily)